MPPGRATAADVHWATAKIRGYHRTWDELGVASSQAGWGGGVTRLVPLSLERTVAPRGRTRSDHEGPAGGDGKKYWDTRTKGLRGSYPPCTLARSSATPSAPPVAAAAAAAAAMPGGVWALLALALMLVGPGKGRQGRALADGSAGASPGLWEKGGDFPDDTWRDPVHLYGCI